MTEAAPVKKKLSPQYETFTHPFAERTGSPEMLKIWSPSKKFGTWRKLWLALAESQKEMGIDRISDAAIVDMRNNLDLTDEDFDLAKALEKKKRHDVMAHSETFEVAAPAAKGITHLAATSEDIGSNTDLLLMREGLDLLLQKLANVIDGLATFADAHKKLATLGYTHLQTAQPTTVGKRAAMWLQDLVLCMEELEQKRVSLRRLKGLKGATGTQAAMLELFDGDADKVMEVERRFLEKIGGEGTESFSAVGQVAPRVVDAQVLGAIANLCAVIEKIATDIRLLASFKEIEEPRELEQIGSSAMAYKRNPMRSERATGTGRVGVSQAAVALDMVGDQWLERTLDDSSTRRVILPTAFLAADSVLSIMNNVVRGFEVYPAIIRKRLMDELPFLASENIMTAAVKAGGDRHALHEAIKDHSMKAGEEVKKFGRPNDLIQRLKEDKDKLFDSVDLDAAMDPDRYVGLAPQQVDMFIRKEVAPIRARFAAVLGQKTELKV